MDVNTTLNIQTNANVIDILREELEEENVNLRFWATEIHSANTDPSVDINIEASKGKLLEHSKNVRAIANEITVLINEILEVLETTTPIGEE